MTETTKRWEGQIVDGRFPLRQFLGGSDHSAVFLTEHGEGEKQKAAIKLVPADPATANLQISQWEAAAGLSHPNLLKLLDGGRCQMEGNDLLFLVMEYAEENLSQILPERALAADETREMLGPVLDALEFLHGRGFVHGDVKPANILAIGDKLKLSSDAICGAGQAPAFHRKAGAYVAPEAISGMLSPAGDVWALGTTLVEVLTQRLPEWQPGPHVEPVVPATLSSPFLDIARQCLRVDPRKRISIADISARLSVRAPLASAAAAGAPASATAVAAPLPPPPLAPVAPKTIISQAVPPRPAMKPMPSPHPPNHYREARPRPRYMVPLIVGALVVAAFLAVPRLFVHRSANPSSAAAASGAESSATGAKSANSAVAAHSDSPNAKSGPSTAKNKDRAETQTKLGTDPGNASLPKSDMEKLESAKVEPTKVEPVSSTTATAQPSATPPAPTNAVAPGNTAKSAVPTSGSAKGEVLDQVLPDISQKARNTIQGKVRVSVKVHVDPSGAVSDAALDSPGPSKFFADLALQAARKWVFSPPELNGRSVASEWRLQFDFRQKQTTVATTQTTP
ncbi:MAG: TonB family protein [Candidatus Acidiferrum sp.]